MDDFLVDLAEDCRLEGLAKGRAEGRVESILLLLQSRFGEVPFNLREALGRERRDDRLAELLLAAANAGSLGEFTARVSEAVAKCH